MGSATVKASNCEVLNFEIILLSDRNDKDKQLVTTQ